MYRPSLRGYQRALSESRVTTSRPLQHRVQCQALALEDVCQAVAFVNSRPAVKKSQWQAITTSVGSGRNRSSGRGTFSTMSRASSSNQKFKQSQQQSLRVIKCVNCQKFGHYACDCRNRSGTGYGKSQGSSKNWRKRKP